MSNNVNEKLKESFKSGTDAKAGIRKASGAAAGVAYWVFGILFLLITIFSFIPSFFADEEGIQDPGKSKIKKNLHGDITRYVIQAKAETWSVPIGVSMGTCYIIWTERFGPSEMVQVTAEKQPKSESDWTDVKVGATTFPAAWVRVASSGPGPAEVILEIRPEGRCTSRRS